MSTTRTGPSHVLGPDPVIPFPWLCREPREPAFKTRKEHGEGLVTYYNSFCYRPTQAISILSVPETRLGSAIGVNGLVESPWKNSDHQTIHRYFVLQKNSQL